MNRKPGYLSLDEDNNTVVACGRVILALSISVRGNDSRTGIGDWRRRLECMNALPTVHAR
jgi:hypothetical protein